MAHFAGQKGVQKPAPARLAVRPPAVQASPAPARQTAPHVAAATARQAPAPASRTAQARPAPTPNHPMAPHVTAATARQAPAAPASRAVQASPAPTLTRRVAPHVATVIAGGGVQRKMKFGAGTEYLNIDGAGAGIDLQGYRETLREAIDMPKEIEVETGIPAVGTAAYTPVHGEWAGTIVIRPLNQDDLDRRTREYNSRLIAMAHETRHGIDDLTRTVRFRNDDEEKIHTEWRAFATQSAVAWELAERGQRVEERYLLDIASFASREAFMNRGSRMIATTQSYMRLYKLNPDPSERDAQRFMERHQNWVDEAVALFARLRPREIREPAAQNLRPARVDETDWSGRLRAAGWVAGAVATIFVIRALGNYYGWFR
jgi:hypothetical protein